MICLIAYKPVCILAQVNPAYKKHTSTITAGYGFGNVWKTFLDKAITIPEYKVSSTGPFTLIYEYGITKRISGGLAGCYSRVNGNSKRFQLADELTILSLLARADYHFGSSVKFDPYFGAGIGINNARYINNASVNANSKVPSTFEYSGQLGIKYFILSQVGIYAEAGYVGGSFLQGGFTVKFK